MVDLWVLFINNFAYRTLGMNEDSAYDSLIVAFFVTSCSLIIIGSGMNFIGTTNPNAIPYITIPISSSNTYTPQDYNFNFKRYSSSI